jgi:uncharacterized protein
LFVWNQSKDCPVPTAHYLLPLGTKVPRPRCMLRLFVPHLRIGSVCELTPERLRAMCIEALLLDVDCTLKRYSCQQCTPEAAAWLAEMRAAGIRLCLVSNGLGQRLGQFAQTVDLPLVSRALKPLPCGCRRALRQLDVHRERAAMVGDQVFADVMAARLAGITAILVDSLGPEEEPWFTRIKRPPERWLLRRMDRIESCNAAVRQR